MSTESIIAFSIVLAVVLVEGTVHLLLLRREPRPLSPRRLRTLWRRWRFASLVLSVPLLAVCLLVGEPFAILLYLGNLLLPTETVFFAPGRVSEDEARANYRCDPLHCGRCNYDLTGNVSGVCPECGWKLKTEAS